MIKENTNLKEEAKRDAEVLQDTINMNQVLMEEIKVKDDIIKASDSISEINNAKDNHQRANKENIESLGDTIRCSVCDWRTNNKSHMQGHMIKHRAGQYICQKCKETFQTTEELNNHVARSHEVQTTGTSNNQEMSNCSYCDKTFINMHSVQQHISSKHKTPTSLPVGHPEWNKQKEKQRYSVGSIQCVKCSKTFSSGKEIDNHMREHSDEEETNAPFVEQGEIKICRYFRRGFCFKGSSCKFKHSEGYEQKSFTPKCRKGESCFFLRQNRCKFVHDGIGKQNNNTEDRECRYKNNCRKIRTCSFIHPSKDFRIPQQMNWPPIRAQINPWIEY